MNCIIDSISIEIVGLHLWDQFVIRLVEFASEIGTPRHAKLSFVVAVVACWVKYCCDKQPIPNSLRTVLLLSLSE